MDKYIKRDSVNEVLDGLVERIEDSLKYSTQFGSGCDYAIRYILNKLEDIPTADVRPERHGEWIDKTQWYGHLGRILTQCSECGFEIEGDPTSRNTGTGGKYCENCGAKMNGKPKRLRDITKKNGKGEE